MSAQPGQVESSALPNAGRRRPNDQAAPRPDDRTSATPRAEVGRVVRVAVTASVVLVVAFGLEGFASALRDLDDRAAANSSIGELGRIYGDVLPHPPVIRDKRVVEHARSTVPERATYRIVIGSGWNASRRVRWTRSIEEDFLRFHLLPRRQTFSSSTPWVFCLGCDTAAQGRNVRVLARGSDGMLFLRVSG